MFRKRRMAKVPGDGAGAEGRERGRRGEVKPGATAGREEASRRNVAVAFFRCRPASRRAGRRAGGRGVGRGTSRGAQDAPFSEAEPLRDRLSAALYPATCSETRTRPGKQV